MNCFLLVFCWSIAGSITSNGGLAERENVVAAWRHTLNFVPVSERRAFVRTLRPLLADEAVTILLEVASSDRDEKLLGSSRFRCANFPAHDELIFDGPQWPSQCGQDWIIDVLFRNTSRSLYYIDLAANDALEISNTFALDRLGWHGLCIEANPSYWYSLVTKRKCAVYALAVAAANVTSVRFNFRSMGVYGGIVGANFDNKGDDDGKVVDVPAAGLGDILEHAGSPSIIDYFSLDVEGAELYIMENFPFNKYRFNVMTIERPGEKLATILRMNSYVYLGDTAEFGDQLWLDSGFLAEYKTRNGLETLSVPYLRTGFSGYTCRT